MPQINNDSLVRARSMDLDPPPAQTDKKPRVHDQTETSMKTVPNHPRFHLQTHSRTHLPAVAALLQLYCQSNTDTAIKDQAFLLLEPKVALKKADIKLRFKHCRLELEGRLLQQRWQRLEADKQKNQSSAPPQPSFDIAKIDRLNANSDFAHYGAELEQFGTPDQLPRIKQLLNQLARVADGLVQLPIESQELILQEFPPPTVGLCIDGTITRLDDTLHDIDQERRRLGMLPPSALLQQLDQEMPVNAQFLLSYFSEVARQQGLFDAISEGNQIHSALGYAHALGVAHSIINDKDQFAPVVLNQAPPFKTVETIRAFAITLPMRLNQLLKNPKIQHTLDNYQQQLVSTLSITSHQEIGLDASQVLSAKLNEIKRHPISQQLMQNHQSRHPQATDTFEQLFGVWSDDYMSLDNWDWQGLTNGLEQAVDADFGLLKKPPSQWDLMFNLNQLKAFHADNHQLVCNSFLGFSGQSDQYDAAQLLKALLNASLTGSKLSLQRLTQAFTIFSTSAILSENTARDTIVQHLHRLQSGLGAVAIDQQTHRVNQELTTRVFDQAKIQFTKTFPFASEPLSDIQASLYAYSHNQPLTYNQTVLLIDLEHTTNYSHSRLMQNLIPDSTQDQQLTFRYLHHLSARPNPVDSYAHLTQLWGHNQGALHSLTYAAMLEAVHRLTTPAPQLPALDEFFSFGFGSLHVGFLSLDHFHDKFPFLADELLRQAIVNGYTGIADHILASTSARQLLAQNQNDHLLSIPTVAEKCKLSKKSTHAQHIIDTINWPIENYVDVNDRSRFETSAYVNTILDNADPQRFAKTYPLMLKAATAHNQPLSDENWNFFMEKMSDTLSNEQFELFDSMMKVGFAVHDAKMHSGRPGLFNVAVDDISGARLLALSDALPAAALKPMASLIYIHIPYTCQFAPAILKNFENAGVDLDRLTHNYSSLTQSENKIFIAELLHAVLEGETPESESVPSNLNYDYGFVQFLESLIEAEFSDVVCPDTQAEFEQLADQLDVDPEQSFTAILNAFSTDVRLNIMNSIKDFTDDEIKQMRPPLVNSLFEILKTEDTTLKAVYDILDRHWAVI